MPDRRLPKTLTKDEIAALMARPNTDAPTGLRNRCILEVMHRCGLRVSEACGLHVRDVKWAEAQIHVRPEIAKGGKEAVVYLDPATLALLERWKAVRRPYAAGRPHLFTTLKGEAVDRRYVWEMTRRYARRAGIERNVHPHVLRHTYATELLGEGFNVVEVQRLLRHSDIRTTTVYLHLRDEDLARKVQKRR
jgi:integrase/recombinase XerD